MNALNNLPGRRDKKWFLIMVPMTVIIAILLIGLTRMMLNIKMGLTDTTIFFVLSFIAAAAICGLSYAGQYIAAGFSLIGLIAGIIFMGYVFTKPIEWVGIVGLVSGAQLTFIFFLVGVCTQMLYHLMNRRRRVNEK